MNSSTKTSTPPAPAQTLTQLQNRPGEANRLERIARGETLPTVVHEKVDKEQPILEVDHFDLWYGEKQALYDIHMNIAKSKVTSLIGPSGCGKSTLLRCVNRMNDLIDTVRISGDMRLAGDSINGV